MACLSIFIPLSDFLLCDQMSDSLKSNFDTTLGFIVTNDTAGDAYLRTNTQAYVYLQSGTSSAPQTSVGDYAVLSDKGITPLDVYCNIKVTEKNFEVLAGNKPTIDKQQITVTAHFA